MHSFRHVVMCLWSSGAALLLLLIVSVANILQGAPSAAKSRISSGALSAIPRAFRIKFEAASSRSPLRPAKTNVLMRQLKADPKLVADQLGHSVDIPLNVYAQSPVEGPLALVNKLKSLLIQ
jgi:hypothetical protein